jgi:hypothetical protein
MPSPTILRTAQMAHSAEGVPMRAATRACNIDSRSTAMRRIAQRITALILLACSLQTFALTEVSGFGSNPGNLKMFKYVPAGLPASAPLVVAMHGCSQSASSCDDETGWQALADLWKFALVLPQQQSGNNSSTCFNWFEAGDITRGAVDQADGRPHEVRPCRRRVVRASPRRDGDRCRDKA